MADIDRSFLFDFFRLASRRLEENRDMLCELDGKIGDGDHGTAMAGGFAVLAHLARQPDQQEQPTAVVLQTAARLFLSEVGATVGPLYASGLLQMSRSFTHRDSIPASGIGDLVAAMAEGIIRRGGAEQGDKTMLDAWLPALQEARDAEAVGQAPAEMMRRAAAAARAGADATAAMVAAKGRAARLKERSLGHRDPGAVSAALIIEVLADLLDPHAGDTA